MEKVKEFCSSQEISAIEIKDDVLQISVKISEPIGNTTYRYVPITDTIAFILVDDPSLDDFISPAQPKLEEKKLEESVQELCL